MAAWSCNNYFDFLFDRSPHFDEDVLKDWFPTDDAWIGHVETMPWKAFTGTQHVFDKIHVGAPDLSQAWQTFDTQGTLLVGVTNPNATVGENTLGCVANACSPTAISVGWGSERFVYGRARTSYQTNVLCFDQIDTRAKAREQLSEIIRGIKDLTKTIWSDYIRANSLMQASTIYIAGAARLSVPITATTFTGNLTTINLGSAANLPTSTLTIQYLERFYEEVMAAGYFKRYMPGGMMKVITDMITSQQLIEGNPGLTSMYKFSDFAEGGKLFKYGVNKAIGNFAISWDMAQARFYHIGNGVLRRVWPYVNAAATIGIKPTVNQQWINAPYAYSSIWHEGAMKRAVPSLQSVHPEMPFLTRDLGGKWTFTGPDSDTITVTDPVTGTTCVIDNKRRNQGLWWSDFEAGFRPEFMAEWTRGIIHLREPGCVVDSVPCSTAPAYITQSYADNNPVCLV